MTERVLQVMVLPMWIASATGWMACVVAHEIYGVLRSE